MTPSTVYQNELEFIVGRCKNHLDFVRAQSASRHCNNKNYLATVHFDRNMDEEWITGWYCTCASGAREVSYCTDITSFIWHLGVRRGEPETPSNPLTADRFFDFTRDAAAVEEPSTTSGN